MKRILLVVSLLFAGLSFGQDMSPEDIMEIMNSGGMMAAGLGSIFFLVGGILAWILTSYGLMLLAKKYEPSLHPVLSWIPLVNLYVAIKVSGQSPLWLLSILAGFIPVIGGLFILGVSIFIYYHIALRAGKGVGTTVGLVLLSTVFLPWLGREIHGKSTGLVIAGGIIATLVVLVGAITMIGGAASVAMGQLENNPEFQEALQSMQEQMEASQ